MLLAVYPSGSGWVPVGLVNPERIHDSSPEGVEAVPRDHTHLPEHVDHLAVVGRQQAGKFCHKF